MSQENLELVRSFWDGEMDMVELTAVKIQCVVADGDVKSVVDTILKHARTGNVGDGKLFVMAVEQAYRARTGESGEEILQAHPEDGKAGG